MSHPAESMNPLHAGLGQTEAAETSWFPLLLLPVHTAEVTGKFKVPVSQCPRHPWEVLPCKQVADE